MIKKISPFSLGVWMAIAPFALAPFASQVQAEEIALEANAAPNAEVKKLADSLSQYDRLTEGEKRVALKALKEELIKLNTRYEEAARERVQNSISSFKTMLAASATILTGLGLMLASKKITRWPALVALGSGLGLGIKGEFQMDNGLRKSGGLRELGARIKDLEKEILARETELDREVAERSGVKPRSAAEAARP